MVTPCCHPGDAARLLESVAVGRRIARAATGVGEFRGGVERGDLADERVIKACSGKILDRRARQAYSTSNDNA